MRDAGFLCVSAFWLLNFAFFSSTLQLLLLLIRENLTLTKQPPSCPFEVGEFVLEHHVVF